MPGLDDQVTNDPALGSEGWLTGGEIAPDPGGAGRSLVGREAARETECQLVGIK
jgi:hypothetical protein